MQNLAKLIVLLSTLGLLVSCAVESSPSAQSSGIEIRSGEKVERLLEETQIFDNCFSSETVTNDLTYKKILGEKFSKELTLGVSGVMEVDIPEAAKIGIETEIRNQFTSEKTILLEDSLVASFDVPGNAKKSITFFFREILREGQVSFTSNGQTQSTGYSYRINLESAGWQVEELSCVSGTQQSPTLPSIGTGMCGNGFDAFVWTPVSTDEYFIPVSVASCWQLEKYGLTMSNGALSILESDGGKANWYGVTQPVSPTADIRMEVHLGKMKGAQIWIGFLESPASFSIGKFLRIKLADPARPSYQSAFDIVEMQAEYPMYPLPLFSNIFDPNDSGNYVIRMKIDTNRLSIWLNNSPAKAFPVIELLERYFFIGYLSSTQIDIDVMIDDLQIQ